MKTRRKAEGAKPPLAREIPATQEPSVQEGSNRWLAGWLGVGLLFLGAFLRVYNFWVPDLWIDEYGTWWVVAARTWGDAARRVMSVATTPPLYFFIVKFFTDALGPGPVGLRLPSILFGIGMLGLVYPLGLRLFRERHSALLALAVFAVNEPLIWFSQDARPYALALFCTMLSFFFYVSLLQTEKLSSRIGYVLATAGAYYLHYLFGFIVVIHVLHLYLMRGWSWLTSKGWQRTFLFLGILCLPGVGQVVSLFRRRESMNWIRYQDWVAPIKLAVNLLDPWVFSAAAFVVLILGIRGREANEAQYRAWRSLLLLWLLVPLVFFGSIPPMFGVALLSSYDMHSARYVLFAAPAALFLVARLLASGTRSRWRTWLPLCVFMATAFVLNLIPPLEGSRTFSRRPQEGWAEAGEFLRKFAQADDKILVRTGFVEGDLLARPNPDPLLVSAINWPLTAHLPSDRPYGVVSLPFEVSEQTRSYLNSVLEQAAEHHRVWVVGKGPMIPSIADWFASKPGFRRAGDLPFGSVRMILLERDSS